MFCPSIETNQHLALTIHLHFEVMRTNCSVNSLAQLQHIIRSKEAIHWFEGLRQAELQERDLRDFIDSFPFWKRWLWDCRIQTPPPQYRDAVFQYEFCKKEVERISREHSKELSSSSYESLQEDESKASLHGRRVRYVQGVVLAHSLGLPDSVGEMLVSLSPDERNHLFAEAVLKAIQIHHQLMEISNQITKSEESPSLPPENDQQLNAMEESDSV